MKTVRQLMKEVPYKLDKEDLRWMGTYMLAERSGDYKRLHSLKPDEDASLKMARSLRNARSGRDRSISRYPEALAEYTSKEVTDYATHQEEMAGAMDLLREMKKAEAFKPYGNAKDLKPGDQVIIAIEGHSLQNRRATVIGTRAGQYLVEVDSRQGTVKAYLNGRDLTLLSKSKF